MGPKALSRAERGTTQAVVEQFALVTMKPWVSGGVARARCWGRMRRWEGLTRGTMRGTLGSRRKFLALEKTGNSAERKADSGLFVF